MSVGSDLGRELFDGPPDDGPAESGAETSGSDGDKVGHKGLDGTRGKEGAAKKGTKEGIVKERLKNLKGTKNRFHSLAAGVVTGNQDQRVDVGLHQDGIWVAGLKA